MSQEREREKAERERRRERRAELLEEKEKGDKMDVDGDEGVVAPDADEEEEEIPTCTRLPFYLYNSRYSFFSIADSSIEAPLSIWPQKHYCDITGLEVSLLFAMCVQD